jgi:hypothetical protein
VKDNKAKCPFWRKKCIKTECIAFETKVDFVDKEQYCIRFWCDALNKKISSKVSKEPFDFE